MKNLNKPYVIHSDKLPRGYIAFEDLKSLWDYLFDNWSKHPDLEIEDKFKGSKMDLVILSMNKTRNGS